MLLAKVEGSLMIKIIVVIEIRGIVSTSRIHIFKRSEECRSTRAAMTAC